MDENTIVLVENVWKAFNGKTVLAGVTIEAKKREIVAIVGPNGCGKTTLLRIIAGLLKPDHGRVKVRGRIGIVFQENMLLPWMKIRDNIALGLKYAKKPRRVIEEKVNRIAELLGIKEHLDKYPLQVSGGTARKAAIARTLVLDPDILLLDEPFTGLDIDTRRNLAETLQKLKSQGKTIIAVDHHLESLAPITDKIYILTPPPTRVKLSINLHNTPPEKKTQIIYQKLISTQT